MAFDYQNYRYNTAEMKRFLCAEGEHRPTDITCRLFLAACNKAYIEIGGGNERIVSAVYDSLTTMLDISFPIPAPENADPDYIAPSWAEYISHALRLWGNVYDNYDAIEKACDVRFANVEGELQQTS